MNRAAQSEKNQAGEIGAPLVAASLALPLAVWYGVEVFALGVSPSVAVAGTAFKAFYAALAVAVALLAWNAFTACNLGKALMGLGLLLVLMQGGLWYGWRVRGLAEIGEGESFSGFLSADKGPVALSRPLPVALVKAWGKEPASAVLLIDGKETALKLNRPVRVHGYTLTVTKRGVAPLFILDNAVGDDTRAGYIPVGTDKKNFFTLGILPHRFYASLAEGEKAEGKPIPEGETPAKLRLLIMREKLSVLKPQDMVKGADVEFEGHYLRYENGSAWVRVEVTNAPLLSIPLYAGVAAFLAGLAVRVRRATKREVT